MFNGLFMVFYRAILTPPQKDWPAYFALTAQARDAVAADGYCMAEERSIPHVTLCKFEVPEGGDVEKVWQAIKGMTPPDIVFDCLEIRNGKDTDSPAQWPMLVNVRNAIMGYQRQVVDAIAAQGGRPEADADYDPHLTLLSTDKLGGDDEVLKSLLGNVGAFIGVPLQYEIAIGNTVAGGQVPGIALGTAGARERAPVKQQAAPKQI